MSCSCARSEQRWPSCKDRIEKDCAARQLPPIGVRGFQVRFHRGGSALAEAVGGSKVSSLKAQHAALSTRVDLGSRLQFMHACPRGVAQSGYQKPRTPSARCPHSKVGGQRLPVQEASCNGTSREEPSRVSWPSG